MAVKTESREGKTGQVVEPGREVSTAYTLLGLAGYTAGNATDGDGDSDRRPAKVKKKYPVPPGMTREETDALADGLQVLGGSK